MCQTGQTLRHLGVSLLITQGGVSTPTCERYFPRENSELKGGDHSGGQLEAPFTNHLYQIKEEVKCIGQFCLR